MIRVPLNTYQKRFVFCAMKIFASLFILATLAATIHGRAVPESLALLTKGLHRECVAETKVTEDAIEKGRSGEFVEIPEFKCYLNCLLAKLNLISKSGVIDYDGMIDMIPPDFQEQGVKMVNDCRETTGTDNCDKAYQLNVCFYKSNPMEYFIV